MKRLSLMLIVLMLCSSVQAVLVTQIDKSDMPVVGDPGMQVATVLTVDNASTDENAASLEQTFQVDTTFELAGIYWQFRDETGQSTPASLNLAIYEVEDVFAASLTLGSLVWSVDSVTAPGVPSTNSKTAYCDLEGSTVTLAATTETAGYAFVMTNNGNPLDYAWRRTGATAGNTYAGGNAYAGGALISGPRDFSLALEAVPEPATTLLLGLGGLVGLRRRK